MNIEKGQVYAWEDEDGIAHVGEVAWQGPDIAAVDVPGDGRKYVSKEKLRKQLVPVVVTGSSSFAEIVDQRARGTFVEQSYKKEKLSVSPPLQTENLSRLARRDHKGTLTDPNGAVYSPRKGDQGEITKQKAGKPEWGRILQHLPNALLAMIAVRKYGNDKYAAIAEKAGVPFDSESWRKNTAQDYLESAQRHMTALFTGERENEEDGGCHHAAQAAIDLCFFFEIEHAAKKEGAK